MPPQTLRTFCRRLLKPGSEPQGLRGLAWRLVSRVLDGWVPKNESGNNSSVR